jgi:Heavy metal binding domain
MRKEILGLVACAVALVTLVARGQVDAIDPVDYRSGQAPNRPVDERDYEHQQEYEKEKKQKYNCPMHPEVVMEHPGNCPECGRRLVQKDQKKLPMPNSNKSRAGAELRKHSRAGGSTLNKTHSSHLMQNHPPSHSGHDMRMEMHSSIDLADPMSREGSGTSWLPDSSPMYGRMFMFGDDTLMLHGAIFPRYTNVSTRRGDDRIDAPNWIMAMYSHPLGDSTQFGARLMMSLDPLTEGGRGYPLLLQSGESWHDQPLHDRQHPHDLFDEVSLSFSSRIAGFGHDFSSYFYFGYPGEPALGPPTFMHRPSAMDDPDAPIGHHWQDSTHVAFGVATAGLEWRAFGAMKIEGSIFTGREPDENRYDFDRPRFDSFSGRISWNPSPDLALQLSHGYVKSPEALEPDAKRHRTTASLIYNKSLGHERNWATSFVWGQNHDTGEGKTQSFLIESNYQRGRDTIYARWERVEKSGHELVLARSDLNEILPVNAVSLGYVRDLSPGKGIDIGLGGQFTIDTWPNELDRYYGGGPGYAFEFFLRIRPSLHGHASHGDHQHMTGMEK